MAGNHYKGWPCRHRHLTNKGIKGAQAWDIRLRVFYINQTFFFFKYFFGGGMPLFLRLFSFIQYITEHGWITSHSIWWSLGWLTFMSWIGGVFIGSHHISSCAEAWAGWFYAWNWWSLRLQSVAEIFWPSSPTRIRTCDPHIRGSSRAVSEW